MKKIISVILTAAVVLGISVTAFAETTTGKIEGDIRTASTVIKAQYEIEDTPVIYSVDIEWTGFEGFTYKSGSKGTWVPADKKYINSSEARWEKTGVIKITNNSNTNIEASSEFLPMEGYEIIKMQFQLEDNTKLEDGKVTLETADNGKGTDGAGQATTVIIKAIPEGELSSQVDSMVQIGELKITIK